MSFQLNATITAQRYSDGGRGVNCPTASGFEPRPTDTWPLCKEYVLPNGFFLGTPAFFHCPTTCRCDHCLSMSIQVSALQQLLGEAPDRPLMGHLILMLTICPKKITSYLILILILVPLKQNSKSTIGLHIYWSNLVLKLNGNATSLTCFNRQIYNSLVLATTSRYNEDRFVVRAQPHGQLFNCRFWSVVE